MITTQTKKTTPPERPPDQVFRAGTFSVRAGKLKEILPPERTFSVWAGNMKR